MVEGGGVKCCRACLRVCLLGELGVLKTEVRVLLLEQEGQVGEKDMGLISTERGGWGGGVSCGLGWTRLGGGFIGYCGALGHTWVGLDICNPALLDVAVDREVSPQGQAVGEGAWSCQF